MSLKLTVNVVQDRLVSELKIIGFALARGRLINKINDETRCFSILESVETASTSVSIL
jgi:hypothetical protein